MDIDGDLFEKETSTAELIPRGVEDMLFDTSEELHKALFASLESIIVPLSPRPTRDASSKVDSDIQSSDELDGSNTFASASSAGNNDQLKDLVSSHGLGVSIQQETPQLLMEGDTLDDQDTNCYILDDQNANFGTFDQNSNCNIQWETATSHYEEDIAEILMPTATNVSQEGTNVSDRSVDVRSISLPAKVSSQSTDYISTAMDSVMGTLAGSSPMSHMSSPVVVTSSHVSPSVINMNSLLGHVSSSPVTMSSTATNENYLSLPPVNNVSYALSLLDTAPYSVTTSLPSLSFNGTVTNEVSSPVLPSSSMLSSTSLSTSDNHHGSTSSLNSAEIDNADQCFDDIIGQSLMLAHNAVQSSPEQLLTSHVHCQGLLDGPPPVCDPVDDVCIKSCDQHGLCDQNGSCDQKGLCDQHRSHDQLMNSCEVICLDSNDVANTICSTHEVTKPSSTATVATVATNMPSKMSFIDWTKIKRKNVTPADYPSTPTPVYVTLDQGSRNPVVNPVVSSNKKKRTNTNTTTGKKRGWVKGRPRKNPTFHSIVKQMPKPPRTGYMYYLSDYRSEVIKDNPQLSLGEVCNYLAKKWGQLPSEQRQLYMNKGYVDRQRYMNELITYFHQKNKDFQQQVPEFDPEWATKYLTQYFNNNSDDSLYCSLCNVQFNSLHNKQQHCLGRKHNQEMVMFVQSSVRRHQKKNSTSNVNDENRAKHSEIHTENHLSSDTNLMDVTVNRTGSTEDSVNDNVNTNVDPTCNTEDCVIVTEDCVIVTEDLMSNADHHVTSAEHHMGSTEDHMSRTKESTTSKNCHSSSPEDHINSTTINCNESATNCSTTISCSSGSSSCALTQPNTLPDCTDIITTISSVGSNEDHVSVTDSCVFSSTDHTNNDDVFVQEHDQPIVHFPPCYSLNHMIHDFRLHQQGMMSNVSENNSQLHLRHAQLQGDCNELEAQVEEMKEQLQNTRKQNSDLQSRLESLSHMINFIAQVDHTQSEDT